MRTVRSVFGEGKETLHRRVVPDIAAHCRKVRCSGFAAADPLRCHRSAIRPFSLMTSQPQRKLSICHEEQEASPPDLRLQFRHVSSQVAKANSALSRHAVPPRRVRMPRRPTSFAIPGRLVCPAALMLATTSARSAARRCGFRSARPAPVQRPGRRRPAENAGAGFLR